MDPDDSQDTLLLRSFLAGRDISCPCCGYNLRGLQQATCPECGDHLSLAVTNYPTRSGGYTAGLVGITLSATCAAILAVESIFVSPFVSCLSLFAALWFVRAALRWRRNRASFSALPRHEKQVHVLLRWLGIPIFLFFIFAELIGAVD